MTTKKYEEKKQELLNDTSICKENRKLYADFFENEEYKLKRTNNLSKLDAGCIKTLLGYTQKISNVNKWFNNKPLRDLTKNDIKRVYDGLEEGTIKTKRGKPFKDRKSYYNKIFKSKLFQMIGKADLSREVMEYYAPNDDKQVRFLTELDVRKLVNVTIQPKQKALLWIALDIGENIQSLLELKKKDCTRQQNPDTKEPEYRINLRREILKRTRTPRSEITNYADTVEFLDHVLRDKKDEEFVFDFKYRMAVKFFERACKLTGVKVEPTNDKPTWKDLRSGMACDLLKKSWSRDEVNARLGHKPSSTEIDKYFNYLALDRHKPKEKVQNFKVQELSKELDDAKQMIKHLGTQMVKLQNHKEMSETAMHLINSIAESEMKIGRKKTSELLLRLAEENGAKVEKLKRTE